MISHSILNHEKSCPSREATLQRLTKLSRPPKDTPVSIKKPDFFSVHEMVPRWLLWSAAAIGISVALFVLVYSRARGFLFP
jgi:hypothetical protein